MSAIIKINTPKQVDYNLFCFHWVGGSGNAYRKLAKNLEKHNMQVYAVTLPGRYPQQVHLIMKSVKVVVEDIEKQFLSNVDKWGLNNCPLIFFGHSYGGLVSYELTKKLESSIPINKIIVSGIRNPKNLTDLHHKIGSYEFCHKMDDTKLFNYIKNTGGLPQGLDPAFLTAMLPIIRGDYESFETYNEDQFGSNKVTCPIIAFCATNDIAVEKNAMLGWKDYTTGIFQILEFPGSHFYITEPNSMGKFEEELINNIKN